MNPAMLLGLIKYWREIGCAWALIVTWLWLHPAAPVVVQAPQAQAQAKVQTRIVAVPCPPAAKDGDGKCPEMRCPEIIVDAEATSKTDVKPILVRARRLGIDYSRGLNHEPIYIGLHGDLYRSGPLVLEAGAQVPLGVFGDSAQMQNVRGMIGLSLEY